MWLLSVRGYNQHTNGRLIRFPWSQRKRVVFRLVRVCGCSPDLPYLYRAPHGSGERPAARMQLETPLAGGSSSRFEGADIVMLDIIIYVNSTLCLKDIFVATILFLFQLIVYLFCG